MIDNIEMVIPLNDGLNWYQNKNVSNFHCSFRNDETNLILCSGNIKNFKVKQDSEKIIICGSVAKYLNNQNITPLTRKQILESLEKFSVDSNIVLNNGFVRSIEIGTSLILKNSVSDYLRTFGRYGGRYKKHEISNNDLETVRYETKTGFFEFYAYDKTQEIKDKKQNDVIPKIYENQNILRLEYRIKSRKGIKSKFNKDLTPFELGKTEIYNSLKSLFYDFYNSIPKMNRSIFLNVCENLTPKSFEKLLAEAFRQNYSKEYERVIKQGLERGFITDKNLERIRQNEKENQSNINNSECNDLVFELDEKMRLSCI